MDDDTQPRIPARQHGVAHIFAAARYSIAGFRRLMRETAARHELAAGVGAAALLALVGASGVQIVGLLVLVGIVMAIEALNTAIEVLTDHVSPDWSEAARQAKDLGSLAVGLMLLAIGLYVGWVLWGLAVA